MKGSKDVELDDGAEAPPDPAHAGELDVQDDVVPPKCSEKNTKNAGEDLPQEYEKGSILCPSCGIHVNIRDETTGGFTVDMWEEHRERWYVSFFCFYL